MSDMSQPRSLLAGPLTLQRGGKRPPGLPSHIRQSAEWEAMRRQIYTKAIRLHHALTYDFRVLLGDARNVQVAGRLMWQLIKPFDPQVLIGPGFGAAPLVFGIALAARDDGVDLQVLMVRDKRKGHNRKRWVEGDFEAAKGKRAIFVDDFMRQGSALETVHRALEAEKLTLDLIAGALFYDMWDPLVTRQMSVSNFPVVALYTRHDMGLSRDCYDAQAPDMKGAAPEFIARPARWWRFALNDRKGYTKKCAPVIADGAVYVADDHSTLWKHDLRTGDVVWSVPSVNQPLKGVVQLLQHVDNSIVYSCYDGTLTRVSAHDGTTLWRRRIDSSIHATPTVDSVHGRVFVNTEQWNEGHPTGHVQCLSLDSGTVLWKQRHGWWPPGSTAYCARANIVVAPCNDQTLTAFDADFGTPLWVATTIGLVRGRPLLHNGCVYAATERGHLYCLDLSSGEVRWERRYGEGLMHVFVIALDDLIFVMDGTWHLHAFDAASGDLRWLCRLRSPGCWCPVVYGDYLVALSEGGQLAVISPKDEVKVWESSVPGSYHQPPAVADGSLVVASNTAGLIAYDIHAFYGEMRLPA